MKNVYLLILFALLNNFCHCQYPCTACSGDPIACGYASSKGRCQYGNDYRDPNYIHLCSYMEINKNCYSSITLWIPSENCMSISNRFNICTKELCAYYNTKYQLCLSINNKCQLKKCEELSGDCNKLNYCV